MLDFLFSANKLQQQVTQDICFFCTKYFQTHFLICSKCTKIETKWHTLVQTDLMASKQMRILVVSRYYLYPLLFLFLETFRNTFGRSFPLFSSLKFSNNCCLSILKDYSARSRSLTTQNTSPFDNHN